MFMSVGVKTEICQDSDEDLGIPGQPLSCFTAIAAWAVEL